MSADGAPVERLLDVETRPLLSVFVPDRLELLKGAPSVRRAHLDQFVAARLAGRAADRLAYSRGTRPAQRPARRHPRRPCLARDDLAPGTGSWPGRRSRCASTARPRWRCWPSRSRSAHPSSVWSATPSLDYRPRSRAADEEEFVAELQARLASDLERGFSMHGPHRDELALAARRARAAPYGSQGEQRLALLALLLAERTVLAGERGRTPLMLLDDVMSELDSERRELLARELSSGGQSVIATTDLAHVPGAGAAASHAAARLSGAVLQEALAA